MKKLALLAVHGMGDTEESFADSLFRHVRTKLGAHAEQVHMDTIYYQKLLQDAETDLWRRLGGNAWGVTRWARLRKFVLFGFADAAGLEHRKDWPASVYERAQIIVARALFDAYQKVGPDGRVVVIAQSLGCHVMSCYFWDAQQYGRGQVPREGFWKDPQRHARTFTGGRALTEAELVFLRGARITSLITTGCNIPVFVAAHDAKDVRPFAPLSPGFEWLNLYDKQDVLGWPLQQLSTEYGQLVRDEEVNAAGGLMGWLFASWNPLSHTRYWEDGDVRRRLLQKLEMALGTPGEDLLPAMA